MTKIGNFFKQFKDDFNSMKQAIKSEEVVIKSKAQQEIQEIEDGWKNLVNKLENNKMVEPEIVNQAVQDTVVTQQAEPEKTLGKAMITVSTKLEQVLSDVKDHVSTLYNDVLGDLSTIASKLNPSAFTALGIGQSKSPSPDSSGIIGDISSAVSTAGIVVEDIKKVKDFIKLYI